jgi:hypothetical protein
MEEKRNLIGQTPSMSTSTKTTPNPNEEIAEKMYMFNFKTCREWKELQGKKKFGEHFKLYPDDFGLIYNLIVYAIEDKTEAEKRRLDLKKGILLTGPIGCEKTSLMTLVRYFFQPGKQYQIKSTRDISFEFEKEGFKVINRYSKNSLNLSYSNPVPIIICFDDLGVEQPQKHFGNECNVMGEILLSRYDLFISKAIPTHLTTNLSATEIEEKYGNRVRSRMREIFNLVAFDKNNNDKRK